MINKLIDIHTHLVPGVDDGSASIDESITILKDMINDGISEVIATPHFQSTATTKNTKEQYERFLELKRAVMEKGLNIVLHFGYEVRYISHLRPPYNELTLNNSRYILIEFSYRNDPFIEDIIYNLKGLGLVPIIAHVERYEYLKAKDVIFFKKIGALIQVNAKSIFNPSSKRVKKLINKLLKLEQIDVIASDTHNLTTRVNNLKEAYDFLKNKVSETYLNNLFYNTPKKIIENQ